MKARCALRGKTCFSSLLPRARNRAHFPSVSRRGLIDMLSTCAGGNVTYLWILLVGECFRAHANFVIAYVYYNIYIYIGMFVNPV